MNLIFLIFLSLFITPGKNNRDEKVLFDGVTLNNWEIIDYEGHGAVTISDSCIIIGKGDLISGIRWTEDFPQTDYELVLNAKRVDGNDFFCGITFPVKESYLTLVLGGWGGSFCGLSCIDGYDARSEERRVGKECKSRWSA